MSRVYPRCRSAASPSAPCSAGFGAITHTPFLQAEKLHRREVAHLWTPRREPIASTSGGRATKDVRASDSSQSDHSPTTAGKTTARRKTPVTPLSMSRRPSTVGSHAQRSTSLAPQARSQPAISAPVAQAMQGTGETPPTPAQLEVERKLAELAGLQKVLHEKQAKLDANTVQIAEQEAKIAEREVKIAANEAIIEKNLAEVQAIKDARAHPVDCGCPTCVQVQNEYNSQEDDRMDTSEMSKPKWPDPKDLWGVHLYENENPHLTTNRSGTCPGRRPVDCQIPFSQDKHERVLIRESMLVANVDASQAEYVLNNRDKVFAIVPILAGTRQNEKASDFVRDAMQALTVLCQATGIDVPEEMEVIPPMVATRNNSTFYETPWAYYLCNAPQALVDFLLWTGTLSFTKELAFTTLRFDPVGNMPWVLGNFVGSAVPKAGDSPELKEHRAEAALADLRLALWKWAPFRVACTRIAAKGNVFTELLHDLVRLAYEVMKSYKLYWKEAEVEDEKGNLTKVTYFQLHGKLLVPDGVAKDEVRDYLQLIHRARATVEYVYEMHGTPYIKVCEFCKSLTHTRRGCPIITSPNWLGPILANFLRRRERVTARQEEKRKANEDEKRKPGEGGDSFKTVHRQGKPCKN
ncbi:hypothetical protein FISHEDRAFT_57801 [Fistulina hepatica ATCC 64428]|uniref:Uncharacterized protein n=1 Tax=Fistulina hepatica ATCC 64428 TaxID=1128425 RepID=A0A0D7AFB7_9AGAR|nr:hypothetical protein FISHEDRAFT_57801 [Fistulina hepatica ATCC 64428]